MDKYGFMISIFSDKSSIVARALMAHPEKKWTARKISNEYGISKSLAANVLRHIYKKGFIKGLRRGMNSAAILTDPKSLISEWLKVYNFDLNKTYIYYSSKNLSPQRLVKVFQQRKISNYAFTLHTGANFHTNFVKTDSIYCYIGEDNFEETVLDIKQALSFKELKKGGNIYLIKPYYKNSVFVDTQKIKKCRVVSNIQLYLDLHGFPQRGEEQADYLIKVLKEKGQSFV